MHLVDATQHHEDGFLQRLKQMWNPPNNQLHQKRPYNGVHWVFTLHVCLA